MTRLATFQACDDVAAAGLGKYALIGIYNSDLLVHQLPFVLPQLYFIIRFRTPIDDRPTKFAVRIERPGHDPFVMDYSAGLSAQLSAGPEAKFFQLQATVKIAPFDIDQIGTVKVFVEDELGENYAGGLRILVGVHPEISTPQIAFNASLIAAHYERLVRTSERNREQAATQLIESLSAFMTHSGAPPKLQFPNADVRILLDSRRIHVFFPEVMTCNPHIEIEINGNFEEAEIERVDRIGFVAKFSPSAPDDLLFNYSIPENGAPAETKGKKRLRGKS